MVNIVEVRTRRQLKAFARFSEKFYRGCPYYVPSLYADEISIMDPKKNPSLADCEVRCFLAEKDGRYVGRAAGIIQKKHNAISGKKYIRFSRFDCIDDIEVARALLGAVEAFGKERGMQYIHGPWGFNDMDREGLLTFGFDRRATYATNYNYPYYEKLVKKLGFADESEWVEYDFGIPDELDARIARVAEYTQRKLGLTERAESVPMKKLIPQYGRKALAMVNEAYALLDRYVPVEGAQMDDVLDQFATIINPRYFSLLTDKNDEVVAMGAVIPSICDVLIKSRGHMTLPAIFGLLRTIARPKELEMALVAVRPDYQKKGVNSIMMARIIRNIIEDGVQKIESNPELVSNLDVQAQWTVLQREIVKRRKCFIKEIE